jgi:Asp-tRNA(Asn)/Glu-tRNA(Gln) amidotransferase A subunit family amidase
MMEPGSESMANGAAEETGDATTAPTAGGGMDRRSFVAYFSALGLGSTLFPGVLWAQSRVAEITAEIIAEAEKIAGIELTDEQRGKITRELGRNTEAYAAMRGVGVANSVVPAFRFDPVVPGTPAPAARKAARKPKAERVRRPANLEEVAFWPVSQLAELVRTRQVTALELTELYLDRLKRFGPKLECVVTLTEERALEQAAAADAEIRAGKYRGPLHGIPWGAKDMLSVRGYRTTWGAKPYEDQVIDEDATVVRKLDEAGAILVAKLTLGALAMGDIWFGGMTRNPWNLEQGSSGSSAGSASATVAGLVGFAIGSETLGSIVSPSTRCGASGLRPTFGRVSRHGSMALSWSMDKLGPLCRSAEDCALVLDAIHGEDGKDPTAVTMPFQWDPAVGLKDLRIGYLKSGFEAERRGKEFDDAVLDVLRSLGAELIPFELPDRYPVDPLRVILNAEAGAAFSDLTLSGRADLMERSAWPDIFRGAHFIPAVEYIQANRIRTLMMAELNQAMEGLDLFVAPSFARNLLLMTNLTGHPVAVVPNGFTDAGTPVSISFIGKLWGEAEAVAAARAYQEATRFHRERPPLFS